MFVHFFFVYKSNNFIDLQIQEVKILFEIAIIMQTFIHKFFSKRLNQNLFIVFKNKSLVFAYFAIY